MRWQYFIRLMVNFTTNQLHANRFFRFVFLLSFILYLTNHHRSHLDFSFWLSSSIHTFYLNFPDLTDITSSTYKLPWVISIIDINCPIEWLLRNLMQILARSISDREHERKVISLGHVSAAKVNRVELEQYHLPPFGLTRYRFPLIKYNPCALIHTLTKST